MTATSDERAREWVRPVMEHILKHLPKDAELVRSLTACFNMHADQAAAEERARIIERLRTHPVYGGGTFALSAIEDIEKDTKLLSYCTHESCGHMRQLDAIVDLLGMRRGTRSVLDKLRSMIRDGLLQVPEPER